MKVVLKRYDKDALNLLLETKNTRLANDEDVRKWSMKRKLAELAYMRDTIKSSWEFVDYVFHVSECSRIFTHQLVRTRQASYAQESQRTVDVTGHVFKIPPSMERRFKQMTTNAWNECAVAYEQLVEFGIPVQDARYLLPQGLDAGGIFMKINLRTMSEMSLTRLCTRTQGEYQDFMRIARERVLEVHPWAEDFLQVHCVATGTCAFPRWGQKECKVYDPAMDLTQLKKRTKRKFWALKKQEARPVAKKGRTM